MPAELSVHGRSQSPRTLRRWTDNSAGIYPLGQQRIRLRPEHGGVVAGAVYGGSEMSATMGNGPQVSRVGTWMGIAFVVLFVAGFGAIHTPSDNKNTAQWARWWTDSGHRAGAIVGAYLMVLG